MDGVLADLDALTGVTVVKGLAGNAHRMVDLGNGVFGKAEPIHNAHRIDVTLRDDKIARLGL